MREYVSLDVLANLICMLRAETDGAMWLVDDEEEARFYEMCAHANGRVVSAPNAATELLASVETRGVEGVVATVHGAATPECQRENVFRPSLGDVASLLLTSRSCDRAIVDICGDPWLLACQKVIGPIQSRVSWIARQFARLRRVCIDVHVPAPDVDRLLELVHWNAFELAWERVESTLPALPSSVLKAIGDMPCAGDVKTDILECDGMDAVRVLAAATRLYRPRGIKTYREVSAVDLIGMLRVAFDPEDLENDDMFWRMKRWERRNGRYPLLRQWRTLDPLEVVWDQRYWEKDLVRMLQFLGVSGRLAAFKMDMDNFKAVNDTLGHLVGDEAIRFYCSIVKRILGNVGEVYRRGGDEVVVLAPEVDPELARKLGEDVRAAIQSEFRAWGMDRKLTLPPTVSIGLVVTNPGQSPQEVEQLLDSAQRQAKDQGKNCLVSLP